MFTRRAFFEPTSRGSRFTIEYSPHREQPLRGTVLLLHAFAEEMNKCRRMAALTAKRLAADGWRVVQFDLPGCGDSSGDFGDSGWHDWCDEAVAVAETTAPKSEGPFWLWAIRAGALLIPPVVERLTASNVLVWQPVLSGQQQLGQFLRLRAASFALSGAEKVSVNDLRARLAGGAAVEVAGYRISPALAKGLDAARLTLPATFAGRVVWLEVTPTSPPSLSPAAQSQCNTWRAAGIRVDSDAVSGLPFWQTQEIAESPALVEGTLSALRAS